MSAEAVRLAQEAMALAARAMALPGQLVKAEQSYVEALRVGAAPEATEAFRVACSALYEQKLDLVAECARNQRAMLEETRRDT